MQTMYRLHIPLHVWIVKDQQSMGPLPGVTEWCQPGMLLMRLLWFRLSDQDKQVANIKAHLCSHD